VSDTVLEEIKSLVVAGRMKEGEQQLRQFFSASSPRELRSLKPSIEAVIALFFHKRRRDLSQAFLLRAGQTAELDHSVIQSPREPAPPKNETVIDLPINSLSHSLAQASLPDLPPPRDAADETVSAKEPPRIPSNNGANPAVSIAAEFRAKLVELSTHHMFEWDTYYREAVNQMFDRVESAIRGSVHEPDVCATVTTAFSRHANEIFGRGFIHLTQNRSYQQLDAITKELSGLQSFLELPLEYYLLRAPNVTDSSEARAVRATCSAILTGILIGFSQTDFGDTRGYKLLPQHARRWVRAAGFLTAGDLDSVESQLAASPLREGIRDSLTPVIRALDDVLAGKGYESAYLPGLVQYNSPAWRLELFLLLPSVESKRYLEIHCYLNSAHVSQGQLLESANRGAGLITAQMRKDLQDWVNAHELVRTLAINTAPGSTNQPALSALEILRFELGKYSKGGDVYGALKINFARDFPLQNPNRQSHYHVYRTSVRNLLRTFDTINGIRLWCSVRRSGKTTASSDLGTASGTSSVVTQTCDNIDQDPEPGRFYKAFVEALEEGKHGRHISPTFFADTVASCVKERESPDSKIVFVLDEYETLFGDMATAIKRDRGVRYTIVQPLLNQMVAFSRQNLLIFIGQRPDAHFIIMDQNQLSPYVEQDAFPLFEHTAGATNSEFRNLLSRVLTNRTGFDESFADAVYQETGGHPWLTVNLLTDFFDWLIGQKRSARELEFTRADFEAFSVARLTTDWIAICEEYSFFRTIVSQMLSEEGREWEPWLHAVHATMRRIVQESPERMECSRDDFVRIVEELKLPQDFGYRSSDLLSTAVPSNFLSFDGHRVRPRIPLMARISIAAHPKPSY
jgi:hypothetical protein